MRRPQIPAPPPPGAPLEPARSKWRFGGVAFCALIEVWAPLSFLRVLIEVKRPFLSLKSWILPTRQMRFRKGRFCCPRRCMGTTFVFWYSHAGETLLSPLEIMESANSVGIPLIVTAF